jgi:hypothetical protein
VIESAKRRVKSGRARTRHTNTNLWELREDRLRRRYSEKRLDGMNVKGKDATPTTPQRSSVRPEPVEGLPESFSTACKDAAPWPDPFHVLPRSPELRWSASGSRRLIGQNEIAWHIDTSRDVLDRQSKNRPNDAVNTRPFVVTYGLRRRDDREVAAASDLAILDNDSRATSKGQAL